MLLDLVLPGIDGVNFVRRLQDADMSVPFAVVTGASSAEQVTTLRDLGMMKLFEKPIHSEDLLAFVHDFFSRDPQPVMAG